VTGCVLSVSDVGSNVNARVSPGKNTPVGSAASDHSRSRARTVASKEALVAVSRFPVSRVGAASSAAAVVSADPRRSMRYRTLFAYSVGSTLFRSSKLARAPSTARSRNVSVKRSGSVSPWYSATAATRPSAAKYFRCVFGLIAPEHACGCRLRPPSCDTNSPCVKSALRSATRPNHSRRTAAPSPRSSTNRTETPPRGGDKNAPRAARFFLGTGAGDAGAGDAGASVVCSSPDASVSWDSWDSVDSADALPGTPNTPNPRSRSPEFALGTSQCLHRSRRISARSTSSATPATPGKGTPALTGPSSHRSISSSHFRFTPNGNARNGSCARWSRS
jgi:hypothetical protein